MDETTASAMLASLPSGYRSDRHFGLVYETEPVGADDLTQIRGIETHEAVSLNGHGVYFVAQIGLWRQQERDAFAHDLQIPRNRIFEQRWVEQARAICRRNLNVTAATELPASFLRTISLLTCALLTGLLVVYFVSRNHRQPLRGVLSADITSLRIPAESKLLKSHVKPGDEVFTGTQLVTLEKIEHRGALEDQQRRVLQLERELQQAEAQAALELSWRLRELDRELFDVQAQSELIHEVQTQTDLYRRSASVETFDRVTPFSPVSAVHAEVPQTQRDPGGILFFGQSQQPVMASRDEPGLPPQPLLAEPRLPRGPSVVSGTISPAKRASVPESVMSESVMSESRIPESIAATQAGNIAARLARLESLRDSLPEQVRQAAGVENLRARFQDAAEQLDRMKAASREVVISCPAHGVVGQLRFREGDNLPEGDILLKILHTNRRYVVVYVPTQCVIELHPGSEVDLTFPGAQHFSGQVADLPMLVDPAASGRETLVAVRVEPVGLLWPPLPIGSQVDASIR